MARGHSKSKSTQNIFSRLSRNQLIGIGGALVVVIALVIGLVVAGSSNGGKNSNSNTSAKQARQVIPGSMCPLTDTPAPGGQAPHRPAVAVKIGNEPDGARPQSGLNEADVVYDTPAEGFIMRYVAIFQCNNAAAIGPVRSVRWVDWHILSTFGQPILTFAGGIIPDVDTVMGLKWIHPANLLAGESSAGHRITSRSAPDNLYTSTNDLYALYKTDTDKPHTPFHFSSANLPSAATPASSLAINFSAGTDVVWKWDASKGVWLHNYTSGPDIDQTSNTQVSTTNIVVQIVGYHFGPYPESTGGSGDFESQTIGKGAGYILRDGKSISVTWHRATPASPTTFTDASGKAVTLSPGRTWVEIVPDTTARSSTGLTISK